MLCLMLTLFFYFSSRYVILAVTSTTSGNTSYLSMSLKMETGNNFPFYCFEENEKFLTGAV